MATHATVPPPEVAVRPAAVFRATLPLFVSALFLSAVLLFSVQPMVGRLVLPVLGGTPNVWNTCMVFFQAVLLLGYLYVHALTTRLRARGQVAVHAVVLLLPLLVLPMARPTGTSAIVYHPTLWLLAFLGATVALPFFAVSTSAPLLQRWFSTTSHPAARDPYFLYAASNAGSFIGLLAYPFVVEPALSLDAQSRSWVMGYALLLALVAACALVALRESRAASPESPYAATAAERITWRARGWWVLLAALPSSLMLGVTTYLTTDVAPVPLLWVVPLALYLLAFALAFALPARAFRGLLPPVAITGFLLVIPQALNVGGSWPLAVAVPAHLVLFSAASLMCLVELASRRPSASALTEFYAWLAVGGVLGGAFNAMVAPLVFTRLLEYPLAIAGVCAVLPFATSVFPAKSRREIAVSAALCTLGAMLLIRHELWTAGLLVGGAVLLGVAAAIGAVWRRPAWLGVAATVVLLTTLLAAGSARESLFADRSFFGVYRVSAEDRPEGRQHRLMHGSTLHGLQARGAQQRSEPQTYYHRTGPVGEVLAALQAAKPTLAAGLVGLGAGSLAAYARPGDAFTFFEIDPLVERIARDPALFTFLSDCGGSCAVEIGDARVTLGERGARFDLLVLDAFSSDAIPVHLLTREALGVYLRRLHPDGVLAFHISNRHLRLAPVLASLARGAGLDGRVRSDNPMEEEARTGKTASQWVLLGRPGWALWRAFDSPRWTVLADQPAGPLWTDDYSSLFGVLGRAGK